MGFVQIIEYTTSRFDEMQAIYDRWLAATEGKRTMLREVIGRYRDEPNRYVNIVEFESYETAMANSNLPETQAAAEEFFKLCDGPPRFSNLDLVQQLP